MLGLHLLSTTLENDGQDVFVCQKITWWFRDKTGTLLLKCVLWDVGPEKNLLEREGAL